MYIRPVYTAHQCKPTEDIYVADALLFEKHVTEKERAITSRPRSYHMGIIA